RVVVLGGVEARLALDAVGTVARRVQRLDAVGVAAWYQAAVGDERDRGAFERLDETRRGNARKRRPRDLAGDWAARELVEQHREGAVGGARTGHDVARHAAREVTLRRRSPDRLATRELQPERHETFHLVEHASRFRARLHDVDVTAIQLDAGVLHVHAGHG